MWLKQCHVTVKKHPVAANQLPQQSLAPEVTRGCQEQSLQLVRECLAPELECLAQAVVAQSRAADTTGLGTPTPLGMIRWRHTHHHTSLCLDDLLLNRQLQLIQCHVREQQRFRVV
jgi:hypothetical protein